MENLITTREFPSPKENESFHEFTPRFQRWLEKEIYFTIASRVNYLLKLSNTGFLGIIIEGSSEVATEGNWRIIIEDGDLVFQTHTSGAWSEAGRFSGS